MRTTKDDIIIQMIHDKEKQYLDDEEFDFEMEEEQTQSECQDCHEEKCICDEVYQQTKEEREC